MDPTGHDTDEWGALREVFVQEAEAQLEVLEEFLLRLEANPSGAGDLSAVFRAAHTIKGGALLLDLGGMGRLAHTMEDVLEHLRSGERDADSGVVTVLLGGADALRSMLETVAAGEDPEIGPHEELCDALAGWIETPGENRTPHDTDVAPERDSVGPAPSTRGRRSLRVEIAKLDRLLEAVGELAIYRQTFGVRLRSIGRAGSSGLASRALLETHADGDRYTDELTDAVLAMRLVPLGPQFRRFGRAVRDVARANGKEAVLEVDGESVELDTSLAEQLVEPLTHLIRNAVDHGIEAPDVRERLGKPRSGTVRIHASRDGGKVVIVVSDDGAGIPRGPLERRAREWGVPHPEELTDGALRELVFQPGFSTAELITDRSGRGVGMDAVRDTVEALRGSVDIESEEGAGTTITIRLPLTMATIRGLEVGVGAHVYILPMESVTECAGMPGGFQSSDRLVSHAGRALPLIDLRERFARSDAGPGAPNGFVVVAHGRQAAALVVDDVIGEIETVMRPMAQPLERIPGMGGSALLPDGRIGLVVDVPGLLRNVAKSEPHAIPA